MTKRYEKTYALRTEGYSNAEISIKTGISLRSVERDIAKAKAWNDAPDEIRRAAKVGNLDDPRNLGHFWQIQKDEDGNGYSLFIKNPETHEKISFETMILQAIDDSKSDGAIPYEPRSELALGDHLLVVDLADVHFGKLCVKSETGYVYNRQVARHRVIEGTKALLKKAKPFGISRILFVMGNDILHTEDGKRSTRGTDQDTDGSFFQVYSDAKAATIDAIKECAKVADVDLVHVMSNHDYRSGWCLSQDIASRFENWPTVNASEYNLSSLDRKYYGFEQNAIQLTHGDNAKEEKLYGLFVSEAKQLIGKCDHLYSYIHHVHHKIRQRRGVDTFISEKDHVGITAISSGSPNTASGTHLQMEHVRSPSAPDSWHSKFGFVNRQGVEVFLHHPTYGQSARFTEWF